MAEHTDPVTILDITQSWERLRSQVLGRIVTRVADVVDIFPVNYAVDGESVVFRTAEGQKLAGLTIAEEVLFEVDEHNEAEAWSVILRGKARRLESETEIDAAETLGLIPMVPTLKRNFVRIEPTSIAGRYFRLGEEPSRDGLGVS